MKFKTNIIWLILLFILFVIATILTIKYDLYSVMGTAGTVVLNIIIYTGLIGILEVDDWSIWFKRYVIKKYDGKSGHLKFKIYFKDLKKKYITMPFKIDGYYVTHDRKIIFITMFKNIFYNDTLDEQRKFYFTINPITNGVTICDNLGNDFNPSKLQFYCTKEGCISMVENVKYFLDAVIEYTKLVDNEVIENITLNKDSITFEKLKDK